MGLFVVDTSSLITLAGAGALSLLTLSGHQPVSVRAVYREAAEAGAGKAHLQAAEIARLFEQDLVRLREPRHAEKIAGLSDTDSLLIRLAEEVSAADLLANDQTLIHKAEQRGLPASFTAEFVIDLRDAGKISPARSRRLLAAFVANGRYSQEFVEALLLRR